MTETLIVEDAGAGSSCGHPFFTAQSLTIRSIPGAHKLDQTRHTRLGNPHLLEIAEG